VGERRVGVARAISIPALALAVCAGTSVGGAAVVTVEGDVRFGPDSTLTIQVGSVASGDRDRLQIQGRLQAGGALIVALLPGFAGNVGDSYEIVTAAEITGGFAYAPPDVGDGLVLALRQDATSIRLAVAADCDGNGLADADEIDQGLARDCDGNRVPDVCDLGGGAGDSNANGFLDACEVSLLQVAPAGLSWTALGIADAYDVIAGDLATLRATGGDFTAATGACLADDQAGTTHPGAADPVPGEGTWFLVRGVAGAVGLSLDTFAPGQAGSRDAEVAASASACP
jgi:hypothetical protein